jgi:hypothetical protein
VKKATKILHVNLTSLSKEVSRPKVTWKGNIEKATEEPCFIRLLYWVIGSWISQTILGYGKYDDGTK